jgi:hypothetical protein
MISYQPRLPGLSLATPNTRHSVSDDLRDWPDVSASAVCRHASLLGAAGEAMFDAQMLVFGEISVNVTESLPFDRVLLRQPRSLRVQVKSTIIPNEHGYSLTPKCGYRRSSNGMRRYHEDDYDLLAIVLLKENVILYSAEKAARFTVHFSEIERLRRRPRETFDAAMSVLQMQLEDIPDSVGFPFLP